MDFIFPAQKEKSQILPALCGSGIKSWKLNCRLLRDEGSLVSISVYHLDSLSSAGDSKD